MMAQLIMYNWTPWNTFVQVNGLNNTTWSPLPPSSADYSYFPYSGQLPRDLTPGPRKQNVWGTVNKLFIRWEEVTDTMVFQDLADPQHSLGDVDMLLWIFTDRIVFSQQSIFIEEVYPGK